MQDKVLSNITNDNTPKTKYLRKLRPHGLRQYRCKDCGGSGICEHGKSKYRCKECGGTAICEHGKHKYNCIECMPLDKLEAKGFVCKVCYSNSTKKGVCKSCSMSFKSSTNVSIEGLVKLCLIHFFGGHQTKF